MKYLLILFLAAAPAFASDIISAQSGNWSAGSTWAGGAAPGPGDTFQIKHAVTLDTNITAGASQALSVAGTGTVSTSGSTTVVGSGTSFTSQLKPGDMITWSGITLTVLGITDNTHLTVGPTTTVGSGSFIIRPRAGWITSTGSLTLGAHILTMRGDLNISGGNLTLQAGSTYLFDSSLAPGTPMYWIALGAGETSAYASTLLTSGSSGSHVTVSKASSSGPGQIIDTNYPSDERFNYTDFSGLGVAGTVVNTSTEAMSLSPIAPSATLKFDHCTFDGSLGPITGGSSYSIGAASNFIFNANAVVNPPSGLSTLGVFAFTSSPATGARIFTNNMLATPGIGTVAGFYLTNTQGFTITGNIFSQFQASGSFGAFTLFDSNMFYIRGGDNTTNYWNFIGEAGDTLANTYFANDEGPAQKQLRALMPNDGPLGGAGTWTAYKYIYESTGNPGTDASHLTSPTNPLVQLYDHCVILPSSNGYASGKIRGRGTRNVSMQVTHSTLMSDSGGADFGAVVMGSQYPGFTGSLAGLKDNLSWSKSSTPSVPGQTGFLALYDLTQDQPAPDLMNVPNILANAHYNSQTGTLYNAAGGSGTSALGYSNFRQATKPTFATDVNLGSGTDEMTQGPKFVDTSRNLATFDIGYLHHAAGTAWATGQSYSVGQIVSTSSSGFYGNATINFRCTTAHISNSGDSTNGQPGVATNYRVNWEFASAYDIRQAIANNTLVTDSTLGLTNATYIQTINAWVAAGYAPQNPALHSAASDGTDIGAVPVAVPVPGRSTTLTVCAAGCDYTTAQAAANAAIPGDTILLQAGYDAGSLCVPYNSNSCGGSGGPFTTSNLTFKSSRIDSYPRGYRITRSNPALARLDGVTFGDTRVFGLFSGASSTITTHQPHGLSTGDRVIVGGATWSAYYCGGVQQFPYNALWGTGPFPSGTGNDTSTCSAARVGHINIRANTGLSNGMAVYFQGRSTCTIGSTTETPCLPPPLQLSTPYYVVNFARGGTPSNITDADSFQISATPGGSPIALSSNWLNTATSGVPYDPTGQDFNIVAPPLPATDQQAMYVVGTPSASRVELAFTPNGSPVTFTQSGIGYNGGGLSAGFYITHDSPIHDITFDGVEIASLDDGEDVTPAYSPFMVNGAIASNYGEHFGINIFRCWIHGHDDQEEFPYYLVDISARSIEVGWSILEGTYSTGNDTQNLGLISTGSIYVHDNELKGATENMFSGGNYPWFANRKNTTGIRVERNFFWKPLKYFHGVIPLYISPTQFTLQPEAWTAPGVGKDCSAASSLSTTNLMYQCYVWETNESSPNYTPAALEVSRHVWDQNPAKSTFTVTIGGPAWCPRYIFATQGGGQLGCGFLYSLGGVWHMDYSFTGTVTCPSGWTCTYMAHPSFPVASSRIGLAAMDTGGFQGPNGTFYMQNRHVYQKNNIESKYGDYWSIEGNVFQHQSNCDGGTSCQNEAIHFSIAPNGSGPGDPVNSSVSTSYSMVRNNIIRSIASGVGGTGLTYAVNIGALGGPWEWQGFGKNTQNSVINNLFEDVGSSEFTAFSSDGYLVSGTNVDHWTVSHNTGADVRRFINPSNMTFGTYVSNIATPYRSACGCSPGGGPNPTCVAISGCYYPALTSNVGAQGDVGNGWTPSVGGSWTNSINAGLIDGPPNSLLLNNILMNRSGQVYGTNRDSGWGTVHYPVGTYLIHIMDTMAGTPPTGQLLDPSLLFQTWNERSNVVPPSGLNYRMNNYRLLSGLASTYPAADSRVIGADIDEIEALTGPSGVEIEQGRPKFSDRVGRQISAGSTSAVMSYLPNGAACTIEAWSNSAYSGTPAVNRTDSGAVLSGGMVSVPLSGLQPGTDYFGKRRCGAEVDVFTFTTTPATPVLALQFNLPPGAAGCQVDYGSTAALGSSTSAMTAVNGICTVTAPAVPYWQAVYLSPTGGEVSRGTIQHRGL